MKSCLDFFNFLACCAQWAKSRKKCHLAKPNCLFLNIILKSTFKKNDLAMEDWGIIVQFYYKKSPKHGNVLPANPFQFFKSILINLNVRLWDKKIWPQNWDISKDQVTIRVGNPAHERTVMCWTSNPYCGLAFWDIKKLNPYFFMPWVYILIYGIK